MPLYQVVKRGVLSRTVVPVEPPWLACAGSTHLFLRTHGRGAGACETTSTKLYNLLEGIAIVSLRFCTRAQRSNTSHTPTSSRGRRRHGRCWRRQQPPRRDRQHRKNLNTVPNAHVRSSAGVCIRRCSARVHREQFRNSIGVHDRRKEFVVSVSTNRVEVELWKSLGYGWCRTARRTGVPNDGDVAFLAEIVSLTDNSSWPTPPIQNLNGLPSG